MVAELVFYMLTAMLFAVGIWFAVVGRLEAPSEHFRRSGVNQPSPAPHPPMHQAGFVWHYAL
jgi:hypothetical protein